MSPVSFKLSIAIPTYNRASVLDKALWNIASQISYADNVQVVISDNGSTDNTRDIVEKYKSELNIKYVSLSGNQGFDVNFINAVNCSDGEYVWVKGDDDLICSGQIRKILAILACDYDFIFLNGGDNKNGVLRPRVVKSVRLHSIDEIVNSIGWHLSWIGTVVAKKAILRVDELIEVDFNNFVHLPLYLSSMLDNHKKVFIKDVVICTTINNSEYFTRPEQLINLFGQCLKDSLDRFEKKKISKKSIRNVISCFHKELGMFDLKFFMSSKLRCNYAFCDHIMLLRQFFRLNPWSPSWLFLFAIPNSIVWKLHFLYTELNKKLGLYR